MLKFKLDLLRCGNTIDSQLSSGGDTSFLGGLKCTYQNNLDLIPPGDPESTYFTEITKGNNATQSLKISTNILHWFYHPVPMVMYWPWMELSETMMEVMDTFLKYWHSKTSNRRRMGVSRRSHLQWCSSRFWFQRWCQSWHKSKWWRKETCSFCCIQIQENDHRFSGFC